LFFQYQAKLSLNPAKRALNIVVIIHFQHLCFWPNLSVATIQRDKSGSTCTIRAGWLI